MRFAEYCMREAALYGKKGNNTLECISMTVTSQKVTEMKTYFDGLADTTEIPDVILLGMRKTVECFPGVRAADTVVYRNTAAGKPEYAVNLLTNGVDSETAQKLPAALRECFEIVPDLSGALSADFDTVCGHLNGASASRLNNLGLRFDNSGRAIGAKYYLNIKKELPVYNGFDKDIAWIVGTVSGCGLSDRPAAETEALPANASESIFTVPEKHGYYPVLLGVNLLSGEPKKTKVYFDTGRISGRYADVVERANALLTELGIAGQLTAEENRSLYDNGIYLRGVGLVPGEPETVRLYVAEK